MTLSKSAATASVLGGALSGVILMLAGLSAAAIPFAILAYISAALVSSDLGSPSSEASARFAALLVEFALRWRRAPGQVKLARALVFTLAVVSVHVFLEADPRRLAYLSLAMPVIVSFLLFGFEYGAFSLIFTCAACFYFFIPPLFDFRFEDWKDVALLGHFIAFSLLCAVVLKFILAKSLPHGAEPMRWGEPHVLFGRGETQTTIVERQTAQRKFLEVQSDLATLKLKLTESDARYRELRHRIRNDFQAFYLLAVSESQKSGPATQFPRWVLRLRGAAELYDVIEQNGADRISMANYLSAISEALNKMFAGRMTVESFVDPNIYLSPQSAKAVGLIYTEAAMNALKHAFPDRVEGGLEMRFTRRGNELELTVRDQGVGFDPDSLKTGFGLKLMQDLAVQARGVLQFEAAPVGAMLRFRFPA